MKIKAISDVFCGILALLLLGACGGGERRVAPFGWSAVSPEADTLTLGLEWSFLKWAPEERQDSLVREYERLASAPGAPGEMKWRAKYWRGRMALHEGEPEKALALFAEALEATDSARYPYDANRIRWNMELSDPYTTEEYLAVKKRARFFESVPDAVLAAADYMTLGSFMNDLTDPEGALECFDKADSILRSVGFREMVLKNNINRANSYANAGDTARAAEVLRGVLDDPAAREDPLAVNTAQWNLYLYSGDTDMLREAYRGVAGDSLALAEQADCEARLAGIFADAGQPDSAMHYARLASAKEDWLDNWENLKQYFIGKGKAYSAAGRPDSGALFFRRALAMADSIVADKRVAEVAGMEIRDEIRRRVYEEELHKARLAIGWIAAALVAAAIVGGVVAIARRRVRRERMSALDERVRREESMRKVMALEIAMKETDELVGSLEEMVREMVGEGSMTAQTAARLTSALRSYQAGAETRTAFLTVFSELNPAFFDNLQVRCPGITESERNLAALVALGLETKHVARLMSIRPESVKQARWRLRTRMGLGSGESLEETLRSLMPGRGR